MKCSECKESRWTCNNRLFCICNDNENEDIYDVTDDEEIANSCENFKQK